MAEGLDLGTVHGELELTDNFTKRLFTAAQALKDVEEKVAATGKKSASVFDTMTNGVKSLAGALGIGLGAGAVVAFASHVLELGDNIQRLADRTGMSTDEVQKLSFVADQAGNQVEDLTTAVGMMQVRMNDPKALNSLREMGVNLDELVKQRPYEQLQTIGAAIAKIPDPAKQAEAALTAFGRSGLGILPTLRSNMKEVADQAPQMSAAVVHALDEMGDRISKWKGQATAIAGETMGNLILGFQKAKEIGAANFLTLLIQQGPAAINMLGMVQAAANDAAAAAAKPGGEAVLTPLEAYRKKLNDLIREHHSLTDEQKKAVDMALMLGQSSQDISTALHIEKAAIDDYIKSTKDAREATQKFREEQNAIKDTIFGLDVTEKAGKYALALGDVSNATKLTKDKQEELSKIFSDAVAIYEVTGRGTSDLAEKYRRLAEAMKPDTIHAQTIALANKQKEAWAQADAQAAAAADRMRQLKADTDAARQAAQELRNATTYTLVTRENLEQTVSGLRNLPYGAHGDVFIGMAQKLAEQGYSFEEIVSAIRRGGPPKGPPMGPAIPGYQKTGGGAAGAAARSSASVSAPPPPPTVGAPAAVRSETGLARGGTIVQQTNNFNVNGTDEAAVRKMGDMIMKRLKLGRLLPTG
jgi:predicted DNA-binding protein YlxM (UPF0122 family)